MPRLLPTPPAVPAVRVARAVAVAVAAATALAGCTVTVEGAASASPVVRSAPTTGPAPEVSTPDPVAGSDVAVYTEWVANGWVPRPILPVTDPDSGVSAWLFGTAEQSRATPDGGTAFQSLAAPASVVNWFGVFPVPTGYEPDARQGALNTAKSKDGQVISTEPVTVQGHPGLDVRIEFRTPQGQDMVDLIRYVELPAHLVGIESVGLRSDERVLQQVQQILVDKLTIPTA